MRARFPALRFCNLVVGVSKPLLVAHAMALSYGAAMEWLTGEGSAGALSVILLAQMFSASTGFTAAGTRGYLDPVMVSGRSRLALALALFTASSYPGWLAWLVLGLIQMAARGTVAVPALSMAGLLALFLVSAVVWSLTLPAARYSGGLAWLGLSLAIVVTERHMSFLQMVRLGPEDIRSRLWSHVANGLVLPTLIPLVHWPWEALTVFGLVAALFLMAGMAFIHCRSLPLSQEN